MVITVSKGIAESFDIRLVFFPLSGKNPLYEIKHLAHGISRVASYGLRVTGCELSSSYSCWEVQKGPKAEKRCCLPSALFFETVLYFFQYSIFISQYSIGQCSSLRPHPSNMNIMAKPYHNV